MSSQRRTFLIVALVALGAAAWYRYAVLRADAPPPLAPVDVVFVTGGSGPYWQIAARGARAAASDLDVNLRVEMPSDAESVDEQLKILEAIKPATGAGVAVSPLDAAGQTELLNKLVAGKMFVVTFDSDAPDSERQGYVGTSNFAAGRVCARLAGEALPEGGKIAVFLANLTKDNLLDRKGGFQEALAQIVAQRTAKGEGGGLEVVGYLVDDGSNDKCAELLRQTLADHPDLTCVVGMNARHGPVLRRVLKEEDQLDQVKIVAFDEDEETLDGIAAGEIYATVAQDPYRYGFEAVRMLAALCRADETQQPIGKTTFSVSVETVRQNNLDAYRAKLKSRQAPSADSGEGEAA